MNSEIVGGLTQKEHDWSKPCIVEYKRNGDYMVVFATGKHKEDEFEGYALLEEAKTIEYDFGEFGNMFVKKLFTPITYPITIKFTP